MRLEWILIIKNKIPNSKSKGFVIYINGAFLFLKKLFFDKFKINFKLAKIVMQPRILLIVIDSSKNIAPKIVPKTGISNTTLTVVLGLSSAASLK